MNPKFQTSGGTAGSGGPFLEGGGGEITTIVIFPHRLPPARVGPTGEITILRRSLEAQPTAPRGLGGEITTIVISPPGSRGGSRAIVISLRVPAGARARERSREHGARRGPAGQNHVLSGARASLAGRNHAL